MTTSRNPLEDPTDPYYLHHGDNPGNILVSQLLTDQDNYVSWSRAMQLAILVKNKLGFLDGSIPKPFPTDHNMYNAWIRKNNIMISLILNSVSKEISSSILYDETAAAIWTDLKVRFHQRNGPHIYNLRKGLMNQTVSMYFTRLKTIWEELSNYRPNCTCNGCTCGGVKKLQEHHHMEHIMSILMGLSDHFSQVCGSILLMDHLPKANRLFHLVTQEENQKRNTSTGADPNPNMAFVFQGDKASNKHQDSQGPRTNPPKGNRPFCTHCNIHGHTVGRCYKIHGYPPGFKTNKPKEAAANQLHTSNDTSTNSDESHTLLPQLTTVQYQQLLNLLANQQPGMTISDHSTSRGTTETRLILPNNDTLLVHQSGSIAVSDQLLLTDDKLSKKVIGKGKTNNGLYMLDLSPPARVFAISADL
ncbi:uncharacterized protein LOC133832488 [Humulus lupulus]|uniref:uncharacterized protein LOC133832488 n=1 Tax=Humulus lupulus TaxID=3486 RepID=UPI002B41493A|nr:uncharacterized protein LOC133832488 [Humulus lupulus]